MDNSVETEPFYKLPLNLQHFASDPANDDDPANDEDPNDEVDETDEDKDKDKDKDKSGPKYWRSQLAAQTEKHKAEMAKMQAQLKTATETAKTEAQRLASLSEDERHAEELAQREAAIKEQEEAIAKQAHDLEMRELKSEAMSLLAEKGLDSSLVDMVMADDADTVKANIESFSKRFNEAVDKKTAETLKQTNKTTRGTHTTKNVFADAVAKYQ